MFLQQAVTHPQLERRATERFAPDEEGGSHLTAAVSDDLRPAKVGDISANGIRLIIDHPFLPGTIVSVILSNPAQVFSRTLQMRVVYVLEQDDGRYIVGGEFGSGLGHDEMQTLLA